MKRLFEVPQALYASDFSVDSLAVPRRSRGQSVKFYGALLLAFVFVFTAFASPVSALVGQSSVSADEYEDALNDSMKEYGTGTDFEKTLEKYEKDDSSDKTDNFGYLIERLFTLRYLNETPEGVAAKGQPAPDLNCDVEAKGAGTPFYHNCDVPNLVTEFTQDVLSMFTSQGIMGGNVESVTLANEWFGLPSNIPNDGDVPADAASRDDKYTALELYGYNLRYTAYLGEWDHIKVYTPARAMSNFGFMDGLRLGTRSVLNGISGGLDKAGENVANELSQGDILGAIGGAWSGLWSGSAGAALNTVVDSSDLNVFNTNSWYRVGYGSTLYGARERTEDELAKVAEDNMLNALGGLVESDATLPDDFLALETPPEKPREKKARCTVEYEGDKEPKPVDGKSEKDCDERKSEEGVSSTSWTADGAQKEESLKDWRDANKTWFEAAEKYNLECTIDIEDEKNRADNIATFYSCIPEAYSTAAKEQGDKLKKDSLDKLVGDSLTAKFFVDILLSSGGEANYNAPWYRFVCTNPDGSTKMDDAGKGEQQNLVFADGTMNEACSEVRAPIQNGFFGNGYTPDQTKPAVDTRNAMLDTTPMGMLFNSAGLSTYYSNLNLGIASFATQTSNSILNLSFSPVLDTLGVDDMVVDLIEDFRESIFFPFAVLVIMGSAFYTFAMVIRTQAYREAFKTVLVIVAVFLGGTILMYKPATVLNLADNVPSQIETAIMGSVFSMGDVDDDELCTATGSGGNAKGQGLDGEQLDYSPDDSVRTMMCENWRIFLFNPWQYGQWGVGFDHTYAAGSGETNVMTNTNSSLVGNASVDMGNDVKVQNWSLYQLDQMASGTSTTRDYSRGSGVTDRDMYRLVDLQAGPDNGAGTDSRYLEMWSGHDPGARMGASFMSAGVSIMGLIVMTIYGLTKVLITFLTALMLLIMPMIFLLGLIPNAGFSKLKNYFGTLAGLMVQRVMLVLLLAMMMRTLASVTAASDGYMMNMLGAAVLCLCFILFRKTIMDLIMKIATADAGAMISGNGVMRAAKDSVPKSMTNYARLQGNRVSSAASGAIGGFMVGGLAGAKKASGESMAMETKKMLNRQRTQGFGLGQSTKFAADSAAQSATKDLRTAPNKEAVNSAIDQSLNEGVDASGSGMKLKDPRGKVDVKEPKKDKNGKTKPRDPNALPKARDARIMSRLQKAESDLSDAREKASAPILDDKEARSQMAAPQTRRIRKAQEAIAEEHVTRGPAVARTERRFEKAMDEAVGAEVRRHEAHAANQDFRDSLGNLHGVYKDSHEKAKAERIRAKQEERQADVDETTSSETPEKETSADNNHHDDKPEDANDREA